MLLLGSCACNRPHVPAPAARLPTPAPVDVEAHPRELQVPLAKRPPLLEQHDDEVLWQHAASTGPWLQPGSPQAARPFSQARLLWDAQNLYLSLYAADQDIEAFGAQHDAPLLTHDAFALRIQADGPQFAVDIAATGTLTDARMQGAVADRTWESHARVAMDMDGSLNDARGPDDEEWVAFVALPWLPMGIVPAVGKRLRLEFARCDVPRDGVKRCGQWAQTVVLAAAGTETTALQ